MREHTLSCSEDMDEEKDNEYPLLNNDSFSTISKIRRQSSQNFRHNPSITSFYTDYFPPDLTKFSSSKYKPDNSQPECMTSAWRVASFFVVVFVLPTLLIAIPLYARYHLYHAQTAFFTDGDMNSFHGDVSTFWCQGQRLVSNGTFEAYLTNEARRVKKKRRYSHLSSELLLTFDDIEHWGIHLIQGSRFTFSTCSRWPGGTLIVVQGEENLRRCFYREVRVQDMLQEDTHNSVEHFRNDMNVPPMNDEGQEENVEEEIHEDGGEVFDHDEETSKHDIVRQLYSSKREEKMSSPPEEVSSIFHPNSSIPMISGKDAEVQMEDDDEKDIGKDDLLKKKKKFKKNQLRNKKKMKAKSKSKTSMEAEETTTVDDLKETTIIDDLKKTTIIDDLMSRSKRDVHPSSKIDTSNMERIMTGKGSFFFNINDTLDVTTGNSSFSSSEEFLQQCSRTVVTVDLSPFPDCSERASVNSTDKSLRWSFRVNTTDNYYFIFTSDNSIEANVISFRIELERRLYEVSNPLQKCSSSKECILPFSFMKSEGVIVDFNDHYETVSRLEDLQNYEILTICQPRSIVYTVFILLVPFLIILFAFR